MTAWKKVEDRPVDIPAMIAEIQRLYAEGRFLELIERIAPLIDLLPHEPALHNIAGAAQAGAGCFDGAIACYDRAIALDRTFIDAHNNRGAALLKLHRHADALASFDSALALQPGFAQAHSNRAIALKELGQFDEALAGHDRALELAPDLAESHYNRGNVLRALRRHDEAVESYIAAIRHQPGYADACSNLGNLLQEMGRLVEAVESYDLAIAVNPAFADAYVNRGNVLHELKRMDEAAASYAEAIRLNRDHVEAQARLLFLKAHMCDWSVPITEHDLATLGTGAEVVPPFNMLAVDGDPARNLRRSAAWAKARLPQAGPRWTRPVVAGERIRIGYFSADFHMHATMFLMAGMFAQHDRNRFEIHAFSYGPDKQDAMRRQAVDTVDVFHDVRLMDDDAIVDLARAQGIDIAIDLKGYTQQARLEPFVRGVAPIQIAYIGYPGSAGADFVDYIVADERVIPPEMRGHYSERLFAMPHCYQVNDDKRMIAEIAPDRAALGLPDGAFVFCCFNNSFKISASEFDIWMRLLARVDGSVLWLLRDNEAVTANLRREAERRGIAPGRLIFAERAASVDHLARHAHADLFLDTFHYNAHTTASDALWAGVPVVTKQGRGFASRVAGSLLHAIDLPDLITETDEDYEALALGLAQDPARLASIKARLAANRSSAPLFDTRRFVRDFERGLELAFARHAAGLAPDHIIVPAQ